LLAFRVPLWYNYLFFKNSTHPKVASFSISRSLDREVESISLPSFAQYLLVYERKTAVLLSKHKIVLILKILHKNK